MILGDEQRLIWPGAGNAGGRVICAENRPADTPYPVTFGEDKYGAFVRFETEQEDKSRNERQRYGNGRSPKRAMISLESLGNVRRYGRPIEHRFGLVVEAGAPQIPNLFTVLSQENAGPPKGKDYRPPPMSFGIDAISRPRSQAVDEFFFLDTNVWDPVKEKGVSGHRILSKRPLERGAFYAVRLLFVDGRGGDGRLEFRLGQGKPGADTELQGSYDGPTGYEGFGSVYPAFGVYQHWGQRPLAARFYDWREAVRPAA
ncbi:hypothetical protein [Aureimonas leprariae]|uniref:Uncharacterized protein n=1 Tax=Plantimonas leprariae TaxID=2615207 RepID=A0A7V7PRJ0_9HYPH|nr:hypothetical protein [Aureimonas leprariae]KAB0681393.1 hypothetical protein F6X38_05780 [Aureimonas leprariae]